MGIAHYAGIAAPQQPGRARRAVKGERRVRRRSVRPARGMRCAARRASSATVRARRLRARATRSGRRGGRRRGCGRREPSRFARRVHLSPARNMSISAGAAACRSYAAGSSTHSCMMPTISACSPCVASAGRCPRGSCPQRGAPGARCPRSARRHVQRSRACVVAIARQLVDQFALVEHDLEHVLRARVGREALQRADRQRRAACRAGRSSSVSPARSNIVSSGSVARSHIAREQVGLVLEVPVDGAARHAGGRRHLRQRRARHAPVAKDASRPRRAAARASPAPLPWSCVPSYARPAYCLFTNIRECM